MGYVRDKIKREKIERQGRYELFSAAWTEAVEKGNAAAEAAVPDVMVVSDPRTGQKWYESEGACGFAEVRLSNGTSSFAKWAKKNASFSKHYYGGLYYWVGGFGQSMTRTAAFARACANHLNSALSDHGVNAFATSTYGLD